MKRKRKACHGKKSYTCKKRITTDDENFNWVTNFNTGGFLNEDEDEVIACPGMCWKCSNQSLSVPYCLHSILTDYITAFVVQTISFLRISTVPVVMWA
jgi:hypothetical protein